MLFYFFLQSKERWLATANVASLKNFLAETNTLFQIVFFSLRLNTSPPTVCVLKTHDSKSPLVFCPKRLSSAHVESPPKPTELQKPIDSSIFSVPFWSTQAFFKIDFSQKFHLVLRLKSSSKLHLLFDVKPSGGPRSFTVITDMLWTGIVLIV